MSEADSRERLNMFFSPVFLGVGFVFLLAKWSAGGLQRPVREVDWIKRSLKTWLLLKGHLGNALDAFSDCLRMSPGTVDNISKPNLKSRRWIRKRTVFSAL